MTKNGCLYALHCLQVVEKAKGQEVYDELVKYLHMVRKKHKDSKIDTELVYAYAKTHQIGALEDFINATHQANLQACGDRCAGARTRVCVCRSVALGFASILKHKRYFRARLRVGMFCAYSSMHPLWVCPRLE